MKPSLVLRSANAQIAAGLPDQARAALCRHLDRVPGDVQAAKLLARLHTARQENDDAARRLLAAAMIHRSDAELLYMLGDALLQAGRHDEAQQAFEGSIRIEAREPLAYGGVAACHMWRGEAGAAVAACERAVEAAPGHPDAYRVLSNTLVRLWRVEEAVAAARRGLAVVPEDPILLQAAVVAMNIADSADQSESLELHRRLAESVGAGAGARRAPAGFANNRDPGRALRVGFLSCDFHLHSCAFFLEGPLGPGGFDRERLVPVLYSSTVGHDAVTDRLRAAAEFRDIRGLTDDQAAALVEADGIDIMVDLNGWFMLPHMRLLSRRVAPIQATYLGYANTTGVAAIDLRIVDGVTDPVGHDWQCSERLARVPGCFLCYTPGASWGEPRPSPACVDPGTPITFGSFNNARKIGASAARAWARVLAAVPGSRLLIKSLDLPDALVPQFLGAMSAWGIPRERLVLHPFVQDIGEHVAVYERVDIAMDSFPYNGTTTTCEALWMGVPVVAWAGGCHRARVSASILRAIGAPELVADSVDGYVEAAVALAGDRGSLARYRGSLRGRMAASGLCDASGFAAGFEGVVREAWRAWCAK